MSKIHYAETKKLATVYGKYFAKDFTLSIMNNLKASCPIDQEKLRNYVEEKITASSVDINNASTVNRYLFECATHALETNVEDATAYETWSQIAQLPSIHHSEIQQQIFYSAETYRNMMSDMVIGTIAQDALGAAKDIRAAAESRMTQEDVGGELVSFGWGILSDGMWLNPALMRTQEMAGTFKPGTEVSQHFAATGFKFARQHAVFPSMTSQQTMQATGELDMLLSQCDADETNGHLAVVSQSDLNNMLFTLGHLINHVGYWEHAISDGEKLVETVTYLSSAAYLLDSLKAAASNAGEDLPISAELVDRLDRAYNTITLVLTAFAALRETKFSQALILDVVGKGNDPQVTTFVNEDVMPAYLASGGATEDLVQFGLHLDPRKGMPRVGTGWTLEHVLKRSDVVIPAMMAQHSDRLDKLRANDAAFIQNASFEIVNTLVGSYMEAKGIESLRPDIFQKITGLSRDLTDATKAINVDEEITHLLIDVMEDSVLKTATTGFITKSKAQDIWVKEHASTLTIVDLAFDTILQQINEVE